MQQAARLSVRSTRTAGATHAGGSIHPAGLAAFRPTAYRSALFQSAPAMRNPVKATTSPEVRPVVGVAALVNKLV
jgi:hypothetical protein